MTSSPVLENFSVRFRIAEEGNPGQGCIGFTLFQKSALSWNPFSCSRNKGFFIVYYTFKGKGDLNCGELFFEGIEKFYKKGFGKGDIVNMVVDVEEKAVAFGKNDKIFQGISFGQMKEEVHVGIVMDTTGDEVQVLF